MVQHTSTIFPHRAVTSSPINFTVILPRQSTAGLPIWRKLAIFSTQEICRECFCNKRLRA